MKTLKLNKVLSTVDDVCSLTKTGSGSISASIEDLARLLSNKVKWCLCGGLAVGVHARPRGTDDIDILLETDDILNYIYNITSTRFRKTTDHIVTHRQYGVSVDLVTPSFVKVDPAIIHMAIETATSFLVNKVSIPVVTREGLVALKLNRGKYIDLADIESILKNGGKVDVSAYPLTGKQLQILKTIEDSI